MTGQEAYAAGWLYGRVLADDPGAEDPLWRFTPSPLLTLKDGVRRARRAGKLRKATGDLVRETLEKLDLPEDLDIWFRGGWVPFWTEGVEAGREGRPLVLGHDIRALRRRGNITARALAEAMNVPQGRLTAMERDPRAVSEGDWQLAVNAADRILREEEFRRMAAALP